MKKLHAGFLAFAFLALASATGLAQPGNLSSWKVIAEGGADVEIALAAAPPSLNKQNTNALQITVKQNGTRSGIVCADMGTTKLQTAQWYDLSFDARTDTPKTFALTVSLESPDGKTVSARTTLPEVGGTNWAHYSVALHIRQPSSKCQMVITLADTGSIWLNGISFVLRKTTATN
jgi:hypothetical protein